MKILLTGDVHVGRASSAVGSQRAESLLAASAWGRIVDLAIERGAAAVLVSGDLVEQSNRYFEARGPIERGLERLSAHEIRTIAVSGNHDFDVLPAMAERFVGRGLRFELLGRGGAWQATRVAASRESLTVVGWSFPSAEVRHDPVASLTLRREEDGAVLGIVHGDLGKSDSRYAPLAESRLGAASVDGWLLGHLHAPRLRPGVGAPWILYPGSPQALDPGEAGAHGAWIVEVSDRRLGVPEFVPISSVRYERHFIDVSGFDDVGAIRPEIDRSLQELADAALGQGRPHLSDLIVDLEVRGETRAILELPELLESLREREFGDPVAVRVRTAEIRATPPLDLQALAEGRALAGLLARAILQLERGDTDAPEARSLLREVLPLQRALVPQSTSRSGDVLEERTSFDDRFLREEAVVALRLLLGAVIDAPGSERSE